MNGSFTGRSIYGVNSTFSSESVNVTDIYKLSKKLETSISLTSHPSQRLCDRSDSSESGSESIGGTIYSKEYPKTPKSSEGSIDTTKSPRSFTTANSRLESETWGDYSLASIENENIFDVFREIPQPDLYEYILEDLMNQERSAERDFRLVCENLPRLIEPFLETSAVVVQLSKKLKELRETHSTFVQDLGSIENVSQLSQRVLCVTHNVLPIYSALLEQYPIYIAALDQLAKSNMEFRASVSSLEESSRCYIPLNWILLKILHRIIAWRPILTRMVEWQLSEGMSEGDISPVRVALEKISRFDESSGKQREAISEFVALLQLEDDTGTQGLLTQPNRRLLRFGWVQRWTQRGLTPRMLLLFSDEVLLAHRSSETPFTISMELKLKGLLVEDGDSYSVTGERDDAFTLHSGKKSVILVSPAKEDWVKDISTAVKEDVRNRFDLPPIKIQANGHIATIDNAEPIEEPQSKDRRKLSPLQVCWHRKTTLNIQQIHDIVGVSQSGYLLRKLRNSNGWQRLWTELTSHTLFFYKTHQDDVPLANLPLLEYKLGLPSITDHINHSNCFKLVYTNHEYFFRTSGSYSFQRWTEALRKAAISQIVPDVVTALSLRI